MDRTDIGASPGEPLPGDAAHRGQRLGLPESGPGSMATIGRRMGALFLDWIAASLIMLLLTGRPNSPLSNLNDSSPETLLSPAQSLLTLGIFALEVTVLTWLGGASFGQRILGLSVVGRTRRLGLLAAALRTFLICLVIPPVIWDADGRGLHDRAVDSVVVRA